MPLSVLAARRSILGIAGNWRVLGILRASYECFRNADRKRGRQRREPENRRNRHKRIGREGTRPECQRCATNTLDEDTEGAHCLFSGILSPSGWRPLFLSACACCAYFLALCAGAYLPIRLCLLRLFSGSLRWRPLFWLSALVPSLPIRACCWTKPQPAKKQHTEELAIAQDGDSANGV